MLSFRSDSENTGVIRISGAACCGRLRSCVTRSYSSPGGSKAFTRITLGNPSCIAARADSTDPTTTTFDAMFVATMSRSTLACPWFGSIANT